MTDDATTDDERGELIQRDDATTDDERAELIQRADAATVDDRGELIQRADAATVDDRGELIQRADAAPRTHGRPDAVYHFSEDSTLRRFAPHIAPSNPSHPPAVWAIDAEHAPLYWFPRNVPRISVWANDGDQQRQLTERFGTEAHRICAAEQSRLDEIRTTTIYRYTFDASPFRPWDLADGQYIASEVVHPLEIEAIDDLVGAHCDAGVELRLTPRLGVLMDSILASGLPFGFVRIRDARR